MPNLTGNPQAFHSNTSQEVASQQIPLGSRAFEANGNEWVYLQGTTSVIAGSWVVIVRSNHTKLAVADDQGPLAIAGTAVSVGEFGWFQVYGRNTQAAVENAVVADSPLYLTANAGFVDDADVAGDAISHAVSTVAASGSAVTVRISYPFVHDIALD